MREHGLHQVALIEAEGPTSLRAEHDGVEVAAGPTDNLAADEVVHALRHAEVVVVLRADEHVLGYHLL